MIPNNELTLKEVLQTYLNESKKFKRRLYQAKVKQHWEQAMSKSIVRYTTDIKIYRRKLYLSISSAPLRQELTYGRDKILTMMNELLGEAYLKEVVVR